MVFPFVAHTTAHNAQISPDNNSHFHTAKHVNFHRSLIMEKAMGINHLL